LSGPTYFCGGLARLPSDNHGGEELNPQFDQPTSLSFDGLGNIFLSDVESGQIKKISKNKEVSIIAGDGLPVQEIKHRMKFESPHSVVVDSKGNLFILQDNPDVIKISHDGVVSTIVTVLDALQITGDAADNIYIFGFSRPEVTILRNDGTILIISEPSLPPQPIPPKPTRGGARVRDPPYVPTTPPGTPPPERKILKSEYHKKEPLLPSDEDLYSPDPDYVFPDPTTQVREKPSKEPNHEDGVDKKQTLDEPDSDSFVSDGELSIPVELEPPLNRLKTATEIRRDIFENGQKAPSVQREYEPISVAMDPWGSIHVVFFNEETEKYSLKKMKVEDFPKLGGFQSSTPSCVDFAGNVYFVESVEDGNLADTILRISKDNVVETGMLTSLTLIAPIELFHTSFPFVDSNSIASLLPWWLAVLPRHASLCLSFLVFFPCVGSCPFFFFLFLSGSSPVFLRPPRAQPSKTG
jgi:hypothetical protein